VSRATEGRIFGYSWEAIQRAQQGGRLIADPAPKLNDADLLADAQALLAKHGAQGLSDFGLFGCIDRLRRAGLID